MKKFIAVIVLIAALSNVALAQTITERASEYERINMSDTREALAGKLGEGESLDNYVRFEGALCAFFESGLLRAKLMWFDDPSAVAPATARNLDAIKQLKQGASMTEVVEALGCEGVEIMRINLTEDEDGAQQIVYLWRDDTDRVVEALFEYENGEMRLFAAVENAPDAA